jgi:hypothetical protein
VLDRLYIHGDPVRGQKRCLALDSASTEILNSYFEHCRHFAEDSQAIAGFNGPGPYRIENNYLEASTMSILFGGADPATPNLVPSDIVIRRNHLTKKTSWRNPIMSPPASPRATATTGGALAAGTHYFKVVAFMDSSGSRAFSLPSSEVSVALSGSNDRRHRQLDGRERRAALPHLPRHQLERAEPLHGHERRGHDVPLHRVGRDLGHAADARQHLEREERARAQERAARPHRGQPDRVRLEREPDRLRHPLHTPQPVQRRAVDGRAGRHDAVQHRPARRRRHQHPRAPTTPPAPAASSRGASACATTCSTTWAARGRRARTGSSSRAARATSCSTTTPCSTRATSCSFDNGSTSGFVFTNNLRGTMPTGCSAAAPAREPTR